MFIGILAIFAAVSLSIVSAFFSINGIVTIFSGAVLGAGIMGGVLELSKVSATVWLYSFWKKANALLKVYFIIAIVILIAISSLGIFGYLSKAYLGQGESTQKVKTEIEFLNQSIANEQNSMERSQKQIDSMDENFSQMLDNNFITKGLEMRKEYEEERQTLVQGIRDSRSKISEYQDQRMKLQQELNTLEVNVGPIKYIAALLYGEENAESYYDNAARLLIILIVIVFDPFAVLLMVAGNVALDRKPKSKRGRPKGSKNKKPKEKKVSPPSNNDWTSVPKKEEKSQENNNVKENSSTNIVTTNEEDIPKLHKNTPSLKKRRRVISNGRQKS